MRIPAFLMFPILIGVPSVAAEQFHIEEVTSPASMATGQPRPQTIIFYDHRKDKLADPLSGLMRFGDWAATKMVQQQFLTLYPAYDEPSVRLGSKTRKKKLHVYLAEARFDLNRAPGSIDLATYVTISFLEKIDPAIKHQLITADDVIPNKNPNANNRNPNRRWCESNATVICIQSRYKLEGKLPAGIALVNKLKEGGRKIDDYLEFQSELRVVPASEIDQAGLERLTGVGSTVVGVLEQNIFYVNQVMQFGKFLAVFQQDSANANKTIATAFMVIAVESDILEKKKEFGNVPVLRNLIPAQVLAGQSTFNSGSSISAGLPKYARNQLQAVANLLDRD